VNGSQLELFHPECIESSMSPSEKTFFCNEKTSICCHQAIRSWCAPHHFRSGANRISRYAPTGLFMLDRFSSIENRRRLNLTFKDLRFAQNPAKWRADDPEMVLSRNDPTIIVARSVLTFIIQVSGAFFWDAIVGNRNDNGTQPGLVLCVHLRPCHLFYKIFIQFLLGRTRLSWNLQKLFNCYILILLSFRKLLWYIYWVLLFRRTQEIFFLPLKTYMSVNIEIFSNLALSQNFIFATWCRTGCTGFDFTSTVTTFMQWRCSRKLLLIQPLFGSLVFIRSCFCNAMIAVTYLSSSYQPYDALMATSYIW
jgi:hypothetical protein